MDLSPGKHQVNIRSRCENGAFGTQYSFCGEQSATITIVVPSKPAPAVHENFKKAAPAAVQGSSSLSAAAVSAAPFVVPLSSFGLPFHNTFLPDTVSTIEHSDAVLPSNPVFTTAGAATASAPFPAPAALPQSAAALWSTNVWSDHSTSLKPIQSSMSWNPSVDDNTDAIPSDDATAKANLPSFFADENAVDFVLEGSDDMLDPLGSNLFGFDEFLGATSDPLPSAGAAAAPSSSFAIGSASPWASPAAPASIPKSVPVAASTAAIAPPPALVATSPVSPLSPTKTQSQGAAASSSIPIQALLQLACDATTWNPADFNEGIRYIFQRLTTIEAATCAGSLRFVCTVWPQCCCFDTHMAKLVSARALCNPSPASFFRRDELMRNPHSSVSDKDRPRLLKTLLLGALKTHAPDIYYARYADQDESA